jgi:hypothetical protein
MSFAIESYGVCFGEFSRQRGYHDFKMDLDGIAAPLDIAAAAICDLCDGACGSMDEAVVFAAVNFLEETTTAHGTTEDCCKAIWGGIPFSETIACRTVLMQWFSP